MTCLNVSTVCVVVCVYSESPLHVEGGSAGRVEHTENEAEPKGDTHRQRLMVPTDLPVNLSR